MQPSLIDAVEPPRPEDEDRKATALPEKAPIAILERIAGAPLC